MSVDFRLVNGYGNMTLEEAKEDFPLFTDDRIRRYLNLRFMPKDLHFNPYCPKPNEPDDAARVKRWSSRNYAGRNIAS